MAPAVMPMVIGHRGPTRWARLPDRADSSSMSTVMGKSAAPAASGEYPDTT